MCVRETGSGRETTAVCAHMHAVRVCAKRRRVRTHMAAICAASVVGLGREKVSGKAEWEGGKSETSCSTSWNASPAFLLTAWCSVRHEEQLLGMLRPAARSGLRSSQSRRRGCDGETFYLITTFRDAKHWFRKPFLISVKRKIQSYRCWNWRDSGVKAKTMYFNQETIQSNFIRIQSG